MSDDLLVNINLINSSLEYQLPKLEIFQHLPMDIHPSLLGQKLSKNIEFGKSHPHLDYLSIFGSGLDLILWSFIHDDIKPDSIGFFKNNFVLTLFIKINSCF